MAFEQSEDLQIDYSSYKWTKLDSKSEDCKKKVEDYFRQQGSDSTGREFCDGKIFKQNFRMAGRKKAVKNPSFMDKANEEM